MMMMVMMMMVMMMMVGDDTVNVCAMLTVEALVRAEKRQVKKSRIPQTPVNLSIHKDLSSYDNFEPLTGGSIPVFNKDRTQELMMGQFIILLIYSLVLEIFIVFVLQISVVIEIFVVLVVKIFEPLTDSCIPVLRSQELVMGQSHSVLFTAASHGSPCDSMALLWL